jgi:hypothetical protein
MCEMEARSETLTRTLLEGMKEKGANLSSYSSFLPSFLPSFIHSFIHSFIQRSANWVLPPRTAAKNGTDYYTNIRPQTIPNV